MTGVVCILMGCGIPTTANYIIMVTVAAPTLGLLGVQPIVAHFFVFYYGVLADITPPVALAAYAAAGMAGADPFKTGNTAFRLGLGKVLVPFVFVFSPSLLLVAPGSRGRTSCSRSAAACSASRSCPRRFRTISSCRCGRGNAGSAAAAAFLMVAPELISTLVGIAMVVPVLLRHLAAMRRGAATYRRRAVRVDRGPAVIKSRIGDVITSAPARDQSARSRRP